MTVRIADRVLASVIDVVLIIGVGAGIGLLMRGAPPSPLFIVIGRLLLAAYLLGRDAAGASLGKRRMKLQVAAADGSRAGAGQLLLRNVTLAAVPLTAGIPIASLLAWLLVLSEAVLLFLGRDRLGDLLAQTHVTYRAGAAPSAPM